MVLATFCIGTLVTAIGRIITVDVTAYNFMLDTKHLGAFAMVAATLASFFFLRKYYRHFFVATFLAGVFGLVSFTAAQTIWGLGFGSVSVGLSPVLLLVGIIAYLLNLETVNSGLAKLIKPSDEKIAITRQEEIAEFKNKFSRKSTEELTQIVTANALIPSALTAARQLLQERP